ncbi:polysaccharide pyruvyl transferase CsaB [Acetoanaerobium pronyense]|uniref:Polysaccharide pyruvyl transferase CsaB n=1 Tax=Acetoanaerobium pronyense TaxID=1482736 RepID=A0ABS4KJN0_9FIRM|nr:polysaccharide pyruvyl transferase CsaB [Acetoanaerobium pronyense]MBP2027969.1 polysaccharide pyruvyl transferase CsaB [Acetoanaerobium pronyense]
MPKILISGYYGFNNIGDEAILKGLIEGVKRIFENVDIVVLSQYPDFTAKKHNVRSIKRTSIGDMFREMKDMDILVSGGGSLFQDVTSKRSIAYYLGIIWLAKRIFKKKVMIYSQGIGPVNKKYNRWMLRQILNSVDVINVRDEKSKLELQTIGVKKDILVTTDTVFGIKRPCLSKGKEVLTKMDRYKDKQYIGISVRPWKNNHDITREVAKLCGKIITELNHTPVLIPFHFHKDLKLMENIKKEVDELYRDKVVLMDEYLYVDEYLSLIGNMDIMVAMRLHGLIFSVLMGVYPVGISYDPKIQSFMHMMNRCDALDVEHINADILFEELKEAIKENSKNVEELEKSLDSFYSMIELQNQKLYELIKS